MRAQNSHYISHSSANLSYKVPAYKLLQQWLRKTARQWVWFFVTYTPSAIKRLADIIVATLLLLVLSPVGGILLILSVRNSARNGRIFHATPCLGMGGKTFSLYSFSLPDTALGKFLSYLNIHKIPVLWSIVKGDISFIGPAIKSPLDLSLRKRTVRRRLEVRPGLISLWWIRHRGNIAYEDELEIDMEYIETQSLKKDLGIVLRSIPALFYGKRKTPDQVIEIANIPIHNLTMKEALQKIMFWLNGTKQHHVCFVNADCVNLAFKDQEYREILKTADLKLADGIGMKLAARISGKDIRQNVNGTDLFPRLCKLMENTGKGVFFLGARPGVAEKACEWIQKNYPGVIIKGYHHGYFSAQEEKEIITKIRVSKTDLLLVGYGSPRQDKWIRKYLQDTGAKVAIGVGGLFDYYSGRIPRAPQWMREIGLEWLYRLYQEPGRLWKRYLVGNLLFLWRIIRHK